MGQASPPEPDTVIGEVVVEIGGGDITSTVAGTAFADHVMEMSDEKVENLDGQFSDFQARADDRHPEG